MTALKHFVCDVLFGGVSKHNVTTTSVTLDQFSLGPNIPSVPPTPSMVEGVVYTLKLTLLGTWTTYFLV